MAGKRSDSFYIGQVGITGTLPLPTGGATETTLTAVKSATESLAALILGDSLKAVLTASTAAIGKLAANSGVDIGDVDVTSVSPPTAIFADVKNVTTAGTRVALASSQTLQRGITITAKLANTGTVFVGTAAAVSSTVYGRALSAGDSCFVECNNLNLVGLDSTVNGEGVSYLAS